MAAGQKTGLRQGVDHIGVTVNFLIHNGEGKLLLQKRSSNCRDEQGRWDIGGGAVEFGETLDAALLRELFEEYRIMPISFEQTKIGTALRQHEGQPTHWVYVNYKVLVNPSEIKIGEPDKVDAIGWFGQSDLPEPLHSMFPGALAIATEHNLIQ